MVLSFSDGLLELIYLGFPEGICTQKILNSESHYSYRMYNVHTAKNAVEQNILEFKRTIPRKFVHPKKGKSC